MKTTSTVLLSFIALTTSLSASAASPAAPAIVVQEHCSEGDPLCAVSSPAAPRKPSLRAPAPAAAPQVASGPSQTEELHRKTDQRAASAPILRSSEKPATVKAQTTPEGYAYNFGEGDEVKGDRLNPQDFIQARAPRLKQILPDAMECQLSEEITNQYGFDRSRCNQLKEPKVEVQVGQSPVNSAADSNRTYWRNFIGLGAGVKTTGIGGSTPGAAVTGAVTVGSNYRQGHLFFNNWTNAQLSAGYKRQGDATKGTGGFEAKTVLNLYYALAKDGWTCSPIAGGGLKLEANPAAAANHDGKPLNSGLPVGAGLECHGEGSQQFSATVTSDSVNLSLSKGGQLIVSTLGRNIHGDVQYLSRFLALHAHVGAASYSDGSQEVRGALEALIKVGSFSPSNWNESSPRAAGVYAGATLDVSKQTSGSASSADVSFGAAVGVAY